MSESRHDPGHRPHACGVADPTNESAKPAVARPTPAHVIAKLAPDPGPAPAGFATMTGENITLDRLNRGDAIGIDGRWCLVISCFSINGHVTVETAFGYPAVEAFKDVRVHLARVIATTEVAR